MYGSNCKEAEREGVSVLHGNRGVYHDDKQPTFRALYEAIRDVSAFPPPRSTRIQAPAVPKQSGSVFTLAPNAALSHSFRNLSSK